MWVPFMLLLTQNLSTWSRSLPPNQPTEGKMMQTIVQTILTKETLFIINNCSFEYGGFNWISQRNCFWSWLFVLSATVYNLDKTQVPLWSKWVSCQYLVLSPPLPMLGGMLLSFVLLVNQSIIDIEWEFHQCYFWHRIWLLGLNPYPILTLWPRYDVEYFENYFDIRNIVHNEQLHLLVWWFELDITKEL